MYGRLQTYLSQTLTEKPRLGGLMLLAIGLVACGWNFVTVRTIGQFYPVMLMVAGGIGSVGVFLMLVGHPQPGSLGKPQWLKAVTFVIVLLAGVIGGWRLGQWFGG